MHQWHLHPPPSVGNLINVALRETKFDPFSLSQTKRGMNSRSAVWNSRGNAWKTSYYTRKLLWSSPPSLGLRLEEKLAVGRAVQATFWAPALKTGTHDRTPKQTSDKEQVSKKDILKPVQASGTAFPPKGKAKHKWNGCTSISVKVQGNRLGFRWSVVDPPFWGRNHRKMCQKI